jgi:hypothetical protein
VEQVDDLGQFGLDNGLAPALQALLETDGSLLHPPVGFGRPAEEEERLGPGDPPVAVVVVHPHAEEPEDAGPVLFGGTHGMVLKGTGRCRSDATRGWCGLR